MALSVTVVESVWNTTTTPKTVIVTGCLNGDWLAVVAGGDQSTGNGVTAATSSTTVGSTGAWSELAEDLDSGTNVDWYHSAKAQVTGAGDVTVQVARTKAGAVGGQWGFFVIRGRDCSGVTLAGQLDTASATEVISCTVANGSAVVFASFDWEPDPPPAVWTPAGQTVIEASTIPTSIYTVAAAYWTGQAAGIRNYGTTDSTSATIKAVAVELVASASPPVEGTQNSSGINLMGKAYY